SAARRLGRSRHERSSRVGCQQSGVLGTDAAAWRPWTDALVGRLRELGWIEGRTIAFEYRWFEGRPERNTEMAAEVVRLKVDVRSARRAPWHACGPRQSGRG